MVGSRISQVSRLYELLCAMERDLGLGTCSEEERRIIYALADLAAVGEEVPSRSLKDHPFCTDISAPTFYRALKRLTEAGTICVPDGRKTGAYILSERLEPVADRASASSTDRSRNDYAPSLQEARL